MQLQCISSALLSCTKTFSAMCLVYIQVKEAAPLLFHALIYGITSAAGEAQACQMGAQPLLPSASGKLENNKARSLIAMLWVRPRMKDQVLDRVHCILH